MLHGTVLEAGAQWESCCSAGDSHTGMPPAFLSNQLPFLLSYFPPSPNVKLQCLWSHTVLCTWYLELIKPENIPLLSPRQPGSMVQLLEGAEYVMVHLGCLCVLVCPQFVLQSNQASLAFSLGTWPFDVNPLHGLWPVQEGPSAAHHLGRLRKG